MATTTKVDMDKCSSLVLYKTMAKIRDEINDRMVLDSKRKPHAVSMMADAAYHYVPTSKKMIFPSMLMASQISEIGRILIYATTREFWKH